MLLMIDNYDSFTYNLVQYLGELGVEVNVVRNDEIGVADIAEMRPDHIVVSPGPCTPKERRASRWRPFVPMPDRYRFWGSAWGISPSARPSAERSCMPVR